MQSHTERTGIITTPSAEAAALYTTGVASLIRSSPGARSQLRAAIEADSELAVALAALAVDAQWRGLESERDHAIGRALARVHGTTRRERQHVEIVALFLCGDTDRARALRSAHLAEFPLDALIVHLLNPVDRG